MYESAGTSGGTLTAALAFPLLEAVRSFEAELYVEGHGEGVVPRAEGEALMDEIAFAGKLVEELAAEEKPPDESATLAVAEQRLGEKPSEDTRWFIRAFIAGLG
jgi:hypothetical protein